MAGHDGFLEREMRRDGGEDVAEHLVETSEGVGIHRCVGRVDQRDQLTMLVVDLRDAGGEVVSPFEQDHGFAALDSRTRAPSKMKPPSGARKSTTKFWPGASSMVWLAV